MDHNSTILICFALKEEAKPFHRIVRGLPSVRILVTGMGSRNAVNGLLAFLEQQTPSLVMTCGLAGGLDPALTFGTVVFEEHAGAQLKDALQKLGAVPVQFYCSNRMITTTAEKHTLYEKTGSGAVEMESGHIAAICRERNIPCATIRVISDTAVEDLPLDFNLIMTPGNRISFARLGLAVFRSPGIVAQLLALRKRTSLAAGNLAHVLIELLRKRSI